MRKGVWGRRDERDLSRDLSKRYGFPLDIERKRKGIDAVAAALANGKFARAQIAALLLQLPDPPKSSGIHPDGLQKRRLAADLAASRLLKADADWDDKHPRTGAPPNPGWFAPTSGAHEADKPKANQSPTAGAPSRDRAALAFVPSAPAAGVPSLLAEDLSATALRGLARLAARFSAATILFDAIFVPSDNRLVEEGRLPGRPDVAYRWAHDENATAVTIKVLIDGEWRTLAVGGAGPDGLVYDRNGQVVARVVSGPDRRQTLVATVDTIDRAVADLRGKDGEPVAAPIDDDREPRLCPVPREEPETTDKANSIAYQQYVSGLIYPLAINVGGVWFDGCDLRTGILLEAKGNIDFMFDENDKLYGWIDPNKNPAIQMQNQAEAAVAAGRSVEWHAQTEKGYRGLKKIADSLPFGNVSVVYDPN
jgi:Restriction endonuclease fold toxin 5